MFRKLYIFYHYLRVEYIYSILLVDTLKIKIRREVGRDNYVSQIHVNHTKYILDIYVNKCMWYDSHLYKIHKRVASKMGGR